MTAVRLRFLGEVNGRDDRSAGCCEPPALADSSRRASAQDGHVTDAPALGNLPQAGSARRKEAAQQSPAALSFFPATRHSSPATTSGSALGELLQPPPPALRAAPQPIKDPRELAKSRPCRRGKAGRCNRPRADCFAVRTLRGSPNVKNRAPAIFDRAEPEQLLQTCQCAPTRHNATVGCR